jgi:membrane-bound hydrogenase subunit beta
MNEEQDIKQKLETKFAYLADKVAIKRERRIFVDVPQEKFGEVFDYAVKELKFDAVKAMTGLDELSTFGVIYHLDKGGKSLLNIKIHTSHDTPKIKTITDMFPGADPYERELKDLFGIEIEGLAEGRRYPLPENWPDGQHPLRKDWVNNLSDDVGEMEKEGNNA